MATALSAGSTFGFDNQASGKDDASKLTEKGNAEIRRLLYNAAMQGRGNPLRAPYGGGHPYTRVVSSSVAGATRIPSRVT